MAKEEVCKEEVRREMVESMLAHFEFAPLKDFKILFGGYSGTSIAVTGSDDTKAVLKVCHGYTMEDVDAQVAICVHARSNGFDGICTALPRRGLPSKFTVSREDGAVCCLLSWVDGIAADKVVSAGRVPATDVLSAVGAGLARLHSVPVSDAAATELRAIEAGGGCDLRKHVGGEYEAEIMSSEEVKGHDFLPFYERQLACLRTALAEPGLPRGLLHADPFLDNILVDATNGTLEGFVDLEDVCVGPLLFDVACCACASCFREDGALDGRRLRALLTAYSEIRPLEPAERRRFVDFMKLTMLCNWCAVRSSRTRAPCPERLPCSPLALCLLLSRRAAPGALRISTSTTARLRAAATPIGSCKDASRAWRTTLSQRSPSRCSMGSRASLPCVPRAERSQP